MKVSMRSSDGAGGAQLTKKVGNQIISDQIHTTHSLWLSTVHPEAQSIIQETLKSKWNERLCLKCSKYCNGPFTVLKSQTIYCSLNHAWKRKHIQSNVHTQRERVCMYALVVYKCKHGSKHIQYVLIVYLCVTCPQRCAGSERDTERAGGRVNWQTLADI